MKTGDRSKHCVLTATSMEQLMSQATEKLKSTTAIRKLYFEDGTEIQTILQIPRNAEGFASCFGEKPGTRMTAASAMKISKRQNESQNETLTVDQQNHNF